MLSKTAAVILAVAGAGAILVSIAVANMNYGSCPAIQSGSGITGCDHTFPGTNIWIGQTAQEISILGAALLVLSFVFALNFAFNSRGSTAKPE